MVIVIFQKSPTLCHMSFSGATATNAALGSLAIQLGTSLSL